MKVLTNLYSWFHHTVEYVKTLWFTVAYYTETRNHHKHFLDRKITCIYQQYLIESLNKTKFQPIKKGFLTLFPSG